MWSLQESKEKSTRQVRPIKCTLAIIPKRLSQVSRIAAENGLVLQARQDGVYLFYWTPFPSDPHRDVA